ncbi:MAG: hypothetical protein V2I43_03500 [Parvularcula sp.]|jgi:hypothetical protein|nr:hypothetical protein [Parvularcula sp.]
MIRRLKILLVDAVLLFALTALTLVLLRADIVPAYATEAQAPRPVFADPASIVAGYREPSSPQGQRVTVTAKVRPDAGPILPGDAVSLFSGSEQTPLPVSAKVLRVGAAGATGVVLTLLLPEHEGHVLSGDSLLSVALKEPGGMAQHAAFDAPTPSDIIVRRYQKHDWELRTPSR